MVSRNIFAIVMATATWILFAPTPGLAQRGGIAPQCNRAPNKQGCTCALHVGGRLAPRNGRMQWSYSSAQAPAFSACMRSRFGR